ncbi:aspartate/glutamate racemase family protein [Bacillus sp. JJ1533]|uniref:aspartate/glutamate racemase family protein n=1 Tax=Bacillus sp. JJ1533 TaxID=3122959 RepID=UPI002FFF354E
MTKKIKIIVPIPVDENGVKNRREQLPDELIRPGYDVEFVSVKNGAALGDSYYDTMLMDMFVFEAGLKAQEEGFDAVCIDTVSDSGLYALRSRLDIPVFGPGQIAFHVACMLGHTFSVITMWDEWFHLYKKTLNEYGLQHKLASLRSIHTRPDLSELLAGKEEIIFEKLEHEALKAINEDGADVIVLGSTTMHQSYEYLKERLPVPVINPGLVMYKYCEVFLELGLGHSKKAFPSPEIRNDDQIFSRLVAQK